MIYVIPEGRTEQKVIQRLFSDQQATILQGEGKGQLIPKLRQIVIPNHMQELRCLILRDIDTHEYETTENIRHSYQQAIQRILQELEEHDLPTVEFRTLESHDNVYTLVLGQPNLRLALHLANNRWRETFIKTTIDDYVLTLSLHRETAVALINDKNSWSEVEPDEIIRKVTDEIPALLANNNIPLREAKDYVRLYAAVMQLHTSPQVFAEKVLAHASPASIDKVFASLQAAVNFLGGDGNVI